MEITPAFVIYNTNWIPRHKNPPLLGAALQRQHSYGTNLNPKSRKWNNRKPEQPKLWSRAMHLRHSEGPRQELIDAWITGHGGIGKSTREHRLDSFVWLLLLPRIGPGTEPLPAQQGLPPLGQG